MAVRYKRSFRAYTAWDYEKEIEDLNRASEQGWQLVKGGCFSSRFEENHDIRYRYQLDYRKIDNLGRYIETFREQGWEYVNSTFNGWHYFRKLYDPSQPEEAYEIFTDRESLQEMNGRWVRIAAVIGAVLAVFAVIYGIRMIKELTLPGLVQFLVFAVESIFLLRGVFIMRQSDRSGRKYESKLFAAFLAVLVIGLVSMIVLQSNRPMFETSSRAASIDHPMIDDRHNEFEVKYRDNYYIDLDMKSSQPMTFKVINEAGETVYEQTSADFHEKSIRLNLPRGKYAFLNSVYSGYEFDCTIR